MLIILALLLMALALPGVSIAETLPAQPDIRVLFSDKTAPYTDFRRGLQNTLSHELLAATRFHANTRGLTKDTLEEHTVILSVGTTATRWALDNTRQAVIATMIPAASFHQLQEQHSGRQLTGLFVDQSPPRHIALARVAMPQMRHLTVLGGGIDNDSLEILRQAANRGNLKLEYRQVLDRSDVIREIRNLSDRTDAILVFPGQRTLDAPSLRALLLHSFRARLPIFAYSPGLVSAGSLLAVYSDPTELGIETADLMNSYFSKATPTWPAPRYPEHFRVSDNRDVARALRLTLPTETELRQGIRILESDNAP